MRRSRFSEEQIVAIIREYAAGAKASELSRAPLRAVFDHLIGRLGQRAEMTLVAGLRATRFRRRTLPQASAK